jgi:tRNA A-37 threonylcarbamoyl transferase component Bud32
LRWIWFLGIEYVFKWIYEIAEGIGELEGLGIYHIDLALRNTIKVTRNGWSTFKIIDFDMAFKIVKTG